MDTDRPLYKHGLPFSEIVGENLQDLNQRVQNRKASLLIIDGGVGEGKTTFVTEVLDYFNQLHGLPPIQIEDLKGHAGPQLAMGGVDFLKKLRVCFDQKLPCIGYDEAGDFSKRGSLSQFNAMLNRTFETFRAFKIIVVIALPCFDVLDNQLFDNQIPRCLFHLNNRTQTYGNFDVYDLDQMNWIRVWMAKWPKHKGRAVARVIPNYRGHFLDIEPSRSRELDRVSTKSKLSILRKSEVKIEGLMPIPELAEKLEMSVAWVVKWLALKKLKCTRKIDRINYYDQNVMNELSDVIENTDQTGKGRPIGRRNKK